MGDWRLRLSRRTLIALSDRAARSSACPRLSHSRGRSFVRRLIRPICLATLSTLEKADREPACLTTSNTGSGASTTRPSLGRGAGPGTIYDPRWHAHHGMTGVIQDITERKQAEERQQLLIRELHHRVKNTLATVQAIVGSTARTASSIDEFYQGFVGRIVSLARTHNLLTEDLWQKAALEDLSRPSSAPTRTRRATASSSKARMWSCPRRRRCPSAWPFTSSPPMRPSTAPSPPSAARWRCAGGSSRARSGRCCTSPGREHGGPRVSTPTRQGFGSRLLQRVLATQLQAEVSMDFPEEGPALHHDAADPRRRRPSSTRINDAMLMNASRSHLVVVDVQARLMPAIHEGEGLVRNVAILLEAARRLGVPVTVTEQYPKGSRRDRAMRCWRRSPPMPSPCRRPPSRPPGDAVDCGADRDPAGRAAGISS